VSAIKRTRVARVLIVCSAFSRLLIKASGAGEYWGDYEGVRCKVYFKGVPYQKEDDDRTYLGVESVKMDFSVRDITMGVENDNHNRVIRESCPVWLASNFFHSNSPLSRHPQKRP
jgi:Haemolymph juvenile hormone binding protein (JHBP)